VAHLDNITSAAIEIAQKRNILLDKVKTALVSHDEQKAIVLMRQYCGLTNETGNRVN
jgi:hypothetical protein